jgi:hypothetical protein
MYININLVVLEELRQYVKPFPDSFEQLKEEAKKDNEKKQLRSFAKSN